MDINKNYGDLTAQRLRELREREGYSHSVLADEFNEKYKHLSYTDKDGQKRSISLSESALKSFEVGDKPHSKRLAGDGMGIRYLRCLADFYGVSADYLLGISDIPSCDPDILRVCEFTGLSQNTAVQLGLLNNSGDKNIRFIKRFLDKIVSYQDISSLENLIFSSAEALYIARNSKSGNSWGRAKTNNMTFTENEGVFSISAIEAAEYYRSLALKNVSQKIDSVFHNMVDELCEEMEAQNGIDET